MRPDDLPRQKKRGNGDGSIFWWEGRQRWVVDVTLLDGKRHRTYCRTETEAKRVLRNALAQMDRGELPARNDLTLARFLTQMYLPVDERRHPKEGALLAGKPSHLSRTEEIIRLHIAPTPLGRMRLGRIGPLDVRRWRDTKLAETSAKTRELHSPTHVRLMQVTLSRALSEAARMELITRNPAALVPLPQKADFEGDAWDPDEAVRFLDAAAGHRLELLFVVALTTGMREGELLGLRWSDVHADRQVITVLSNVVWVHGRAIHGDPKTQRSRRTLPLIPMAREALQRQRRRQAAERIAAGPEWSDLDLVFPNTVGKPINASTFRTRVYHKLVDAAQVKRIRFQDIRGTTATLLRYLGEDDDIIKQLLGHALVETSRKHYIHLEENPRLRAALNRLGQLLTSVGREDGTSSAG